MLRDRPAGTLVRSSKTRAMFAMRACRKSTMVGEPLNANTSWRVATNTVYMDASHPSALVLPVVYPDGK